MATTHIGVPAVVVLALLHVWEGGEGWLAFLPDTVVFFLGLPVFAWAKNRWSVKRMGWFMVAWLAAIAIAVQYTFGPEMGVAVVWVAVAVVGQLYAGSLALGVAVACMAISMFAHGWLYSTGRMAFLSPSLVVPGFDVWIRMAVSVAAGMIGVGLAMRALLRGLALAVDRECSERVEREETEARREALQMAMETRQHFDVLGRVAAGVAHDVNNALTVVLGTAELILDDPDRELRRTSLNDLRQVALSAAQTTRQLLSYVPKPAFEPRIVDADEIVSQVARTVKRLLPDNISIHFSAQSRAKVLVDAGDLQQAFLNLILNARDAMPQGGTIWLRAAKVLDRSGTARVALSVADTGTGIAPEIREKIFEPLFTTKSAGRGTGLGLASVKQFVDEAGGCVTVDSMQGLGSTFVMWLPVGKGEDWVALGTAKPRAGNGERGLLVEDRVEVLNMCRRLLGRARYRVDVATDGDTALRLLESGGEFDFLCIDSSIPGASAAEVIEDFWIKRPGRPVLVCAGDVTDARLRALMESGGARVLTKPYTATELLACVSEMLREGERAVV